MSKLGADNNHKRVLDPDKSLNYALAPSDGAFCITIIQLNLNSLSVNSFNKLH